MTADVSPGQLEDEDGSASILRGTRVAEQYRSLRAIIESSGPRQALEGDGQDSIVVLVVGIEHGVADVAIRLAASFADGGSSTLLVDADLRAPNRHRLLRPGGVAPVGLSDWLRPESSWTEAPAYPSGLANLAVLPAGAEASAEQDPFASDRLPALIRAIRRERERTVLLTAPVGQVADALFLAPHADGVLLVVAPAKSHGPTATKARDSLLATGARLYGVVLGEPEAR